MLLFRRCSNTAHILSIMSTTITALLLSSMARPVRARAAFASTTTAAATKFEGTFQRQRQPSTLRRPISSLVVASNTIRWPDHRSTNHPSLGRRRHLFSYLMSADSDSEDDGPSKTLESEWDLKGLKQEISRVTLRAHKKVGKASTKLRKAQELVDKLTADENATLEQLEACPNVDAIELELSEMQTRLQNLNQLTELLLPLKKSKMVLPLETAQLALDLGLKDAPPQRQPRGPTKRKGPRQKNPPKTRLPYRRFYTLDKTEIRVGKQAEDNDELSLSPEHRAGSDWWMHAAGCPGSHVVIRRGDEALDNETVQDAAALTARQSKCTGNTIKVSMTRCRHIQKPRGAKAGMVQLTGPVRSITVNMKEAEKRLERLDRTVEIN